MKVIIIQVSLPNLHQKDFVARPPRKTISTRKKRKRARSVAPTAPAQDAASDPTEEMPARTIRQRLETKGAKKYATNSELQSELKRVYEELDRSQSSIAEKDKIIASLSKKINTLKDQVSSASDAVRKANATTKEAESAARTMHNKAQNKISKLKIALHEKDEDIAALMSSMHDTVRAEVDAVVDKMEVCFLSCQ
jgi:predicted  nucleic acid-binding Zn-ribbon protein